MKRNAGFSLVEMLVVIAVIGVLSAVAVPYYLRIDSRAAEVSARRNAQQAASLSASANILGIDHVVAETDGGVEATLNVLSNGIEKLDNSGLLVRLNLTQDEVVKAAEFLEITPYDSHRQLIYLGNL